MPIELRTTLIDAPLKGRLGTPLTLGRVTTPGHTLLESVMRRIAARGLAFHGRRTVILYAARDRLLRSHLALIFSSALSDAVLVGLVTDCATFVRTRRRAIVSEAHRRRLASLFAALIFAAAVRDASTRDPPADLATKVLAIMGQAAGILHALLDHVARLHGAIVLRTASRDASIEGVAAGCPTLVSADLILHTLLVTVFAERRSYVLALVLTSALGDASFQGCLCPRLAPAFARGRTAALIAGERKVRRIYGQESPQNHRP